MNTRSFLTIVPVFSSLILLVQTSALATGILTTSDVNVGPGSSLSFTLNGPIPGAQYDQIIATNSVTINDASLALTLGYTPTPGTMFEIINNQGSSAVNGTGFFGLPQGALFNVSGESFEISYQGGTGNDIVLTAEGPAGVPDSGSTFGLLMLSLTGLFGAARFRSLRVA